jgi:pimeloyl-ACP methyl ester carboxylesterase
MLHHPSFHGLRPTLAALALTVAAAAGLAPAGAHAAPTQAEAKPAVATSPALSRQYRVTAPDGVTLAVQESGNPDGPPVIFVHGLLGSRLSWDAQVASARLQRYRLITYDLRGHGLSGKPVAAEAYTDGRRWADDLAAVMAASGARDPVLVGWSLGAAVVTNYLAAYGDGRIAGAVYVGGVIELEPTQIAPHPDVYRDLASTDLRTQLDAERAFLALCFQTEPEAVTFQRLLANAALASSEMVAAVPSMSIAARAGLGEMRKPLLLVYGARDALVQAGPSMERAKHLNRRLRGIVYDGAGHAPFLEEPDRFNGDLAAFIEDAIRR